MALVLNKAIGIGNPVKELFSAKMLGLSREQLDQFEKDGFLVVQDFFDQDTVQRMKDRSSELIEAMTLDGLPRTRFSTDDATQVGDEYFLDSSDKISYFFEEDALDAQGELVVSKDRAINKIGHGLHFHDTLFRDVTLQPSVAAILRSLGYQAPILLQSMLIFKQPRIGGKVTPHQDSTFLHTTPLSAVGFWFPLENATLENGCLWFIPGSHTWSDRITRRFKRNPEYFQQGNKHVRAMQIVYEDDTAHMPEENDGRFVPVEVPAGACVLIHGSVVHKSDRNTSGRSRVAYAFHAVESQVAGVEYSAENWLHMPPGKSFELLYEEVRGGVGGALPRFVGH